MDGEWIKSQHPTVEPSIHPSQSPSMAALILAIIIAVAAIFWWAGVPALRARQRRALSSKPLPEAWKPWLEHVPAYRHLPAELRERLHGLIQVFVKEKNFVGCNGLVLTDRMRVIIAANACLLVLNRPGIPHNNL